jgi:TDG/mug DNA glycosylase family protein
VPPARKNSYRGLDLTAARTRTVPDVLPPPGEPFGVLFCGINPGLYSAATGHHFARPGNRFWPAMLAAGLVTTSHDALGALDAGIGMTDLVKRATKGTKELAADEYRAGAQRVQRLVHWLRPPVVLFVGLEGWRAAIDRHAQPGFQPSPFGGVRAYVMPSTSGLNAHAQLPDLVGHIRAALGEG